MALAYGISVDNNQAGFQAPEPVEATPQSSMQRAWAGL